MSRAASGQRTGTALPSSFGKSALKSTGYGSGKHGKHQLYVYCVLITVLITVCWTSYAEWAAAPPGRRMAEETIDAAVASGRLPLNTRACTTRTLPLLGAQSYRPTLFAEVTGHATVLTVHQCAEHCISCMVHGRGQHYPQACPAGLMCLVDVGVP
jgi:hypothetical protein